MKIIIYYLLLLIFIAILTGFLLSGRAETMGMGQMIGVSAALAIYTVILSVVGEGKNLDERDVLHRNLANRAGLIAGTAILSIGIIYQLFVNYYLDWWLLIGLVVINLTKITSLIYLNYRR